ncbi:hypothetical protein [Chakrabartyella piscis]|uniref:hypothetical protein n=1 Tax=Chakrabartyella piscis TaxID=2918914 RepID=UPI00295879AB|nr:hypothetical protein [Chakrabartyella piscis]
MIDVQAQLDQVGKLHREKRQMQKTVLYTTHKKVGMVMLEISDHEKKQMLNKVQKFYHSKIDTIYKQINSQRAGDGQPLLNNPF